MTTTEPNGDQREDEERERIVEPHEGDTDGSDVQDEQDSDDSDQEGDKAPDPDAQYRNS